MNRAAALRWGILGTGRVTRWLIAALRASARNEVVGAASRTPARAQEFTREWALPRAFGSYEAMLDDPDIDVVYNALPNHLHAEWTIAAARRGKHVLCEKPLALTPGDVDRMADAARSAGVVVAEAFMYRHHPQTERVKDLVEGGAVGALRLVRGSFTFTLTRTDDVRLDPAKGGGSLWDVGCYPVSYARLLAGAEPVDVFGWQALGPTGVDEAFAGQLRFAPGGSGAQPRSGVSPRGPSDGIDSRRESPQFWRRVWCAVAKNRSGGRAWCALRFNGSVFEEDVEATRTLPAEACDLDGSEVDAE